MVPNHQLSTIFFVILSYSHVETALLDLILDVGTVLLADVAKHLREHPLQRIVAHLLVEGIVTVVADVEGGAVKVALPL